MKTFQLSAYFFLAIAFSAWAQGTDSVPVALHKGAQAALSTVQSYQDVLSQVPAELRTVKPRAWTQLQREQANIALKESLIDSETPAKLHLKVLDIADWGGWTFYSDIPNGEGYFIRVFGKFNDDWKEKFRALKKGDTVLLEGALNSLTFRQLWGKFTLSICLKDCTFIKTASVNEPKVAL